MDFFQRAPPFLIQLQNILRKYPDGGQILKELIQNADDAKATEVIFVYDERQYGAETLHSKDLHVVQGPALLAYNNEIFTDQDWDGIQKPGNSIKRKDPDTVGRFGLGFNSVYHITDHPAIFSSKNIGFLDPQERIFRRGGCLWNLEKERQDLEEFSDQFLPFQKALEALGLGRWEEILNSGHFNGTLFRFPLRLDTSEISDNIYDSERVQELFDSFVRDASISLLFLRHVTRVALKNIDRCGALTTLLTVEVSTKETFVNKSADLDIKTHIKVATLNRFGREKELSKWLVTSSNIQGNLFPDLTELSNKLCNKPGLDLAYPLSEACMDYGGRLSCILPLPDKEENRTGLPLIINGCFDLTDDRRSLKWPEIDQQHDEAAKWNHILVEQVLPLLYKYTVCNTVSLVKSSKIPADVLYKIWPDPERTRHKKIWHKLTRQMAETLMKVRVFQIADQSRWVSASEAVFLLVREFEAKLSVCLQEVLLLLGASLVKVPRHVYSSLQLATKLDSVSPSLVRKFLHKDGWHGVSSENKMMLLRYAISDGRYNELLNLQLLPLADGKFTSFQSTECNGMVYIDGKDFPRILLPGLADRFIPKDLPEDLRTFFSNIGKAETFKNLVCLNEDVVLGRLHEALPKRWRNHLDIVNWNPQDQDSPLVQWINTLWTFLQRYSTLHHFENQPIVPLNKVTEKSTNIQLARLKKKTTLLLKNKDGHLLDDCTSKLLEKAGCTIIQEENSWLWHKNLDVYILAPTPNNILKTLSHLNLDQVTKVLTDVSEEDIKRFCEVLSQAYSFTFPELEILYKLPIFCSAPCIAAPSSKLVAAVYLAAVDKDTVPAVSDSLMFPDVLIKCRDALDKRLLQLMQIRLLSAKDVALLMAKAIQTGSYSAFPAEIEKTMLWILSNGHVLFAQNDQLRNLCKSLSFIPCDGSLKQPSSLFDPNVDILKELFDAHHFPPLNFQEDSVLTSLKQLGIKDSIHKITPDEILQIAETLSHMKNEKGQSCLRKAKALIMVCNETAVLSQITSVNLKRLCNLSWVPAKTHNSQMVFGEPENLRDVAYRDIVEFSMPLTNDFKKEASDRLGLSKPPPSAKVIESLKVLGQKYSQMDQYSLERKLHNIYKYIQDNLCQLYDDLLSEVMIWNGESFSCPDEIVLSYPEGLDLSSFTKKVPPAYLTYQNLFSKCGVKKTLSNQDVVNVLHTVKQRLGDACSNVRTSKDLKLALSVLDWMKTNSIQGTDDLPIPVQSENNGFSLEPLSKTLFCDIDKRHLTGNFADTDCFIVHDDVSVATAKFLKIQLLSTKVLKPDYFEAWGPNEPVTLRIKNILREYSEHSEVFKELLQNADDADATVCKFLVDRRENLDSRQTLIDPGMASCHGPALWSYNNSIFTDKDFINITRIGAATKETQMQKIGKFGLGFNTVYHITDVPAIMSSSTLIIFDPNVNHLQKHIPSNNPGIKLNLQKNAKPLYTFPDQFQPFIGVFGCDFAEEPFNFDGTLIRLPFRSEEEAKKSKICHQAFSEEEINMLISDFESFADILLIFIKHVKEVELNCLNKGSTPEDQLTKVHLRKDILERLAVPQTGLLQKEQMDVSQKLTVPMEILVDITTSKIIKISVRKAVKDDDKYFLIQSSLGIKESFQMFMQDDNIISFPASGLAIPLKKDHSTGKWAPDLEDFQGMVFCFLPLPVSSGLPFHINAAFAVMSNRKNLWDTTVKGDWNRKLLCDALLVAAITALSQMQILHQKGDLKDYYYYTFWPDISKVNTFFTGAVKSFYQAITFGFGNSLPTLISNGQEWCTIKQACFLELEDFQNLAIQSIAKKVFSYVLKKPNLSVSLPQWVRESLRACGCLKELQNNFYSTERFYKEILLQNLDAINAKDRDMLVLYAIDLQNKILDSILSSKPCIPSSDGKLQLIGKLVHPMGKVSILYDPQERRFPEGDEFLKPERLARLQILGMLKDRLPMEELMARTSRIPNIWRIDRTKALKQICCVLELLNDLLQQEPDAVHCGEFRDIVFLPAIPPQKEDVSGNLTLMKSKGLYHYKHRALVCLVEPVLGKEHLEKVKLSEVLLTFLGLDQSPSFSTVLSQLEGACKAPNLLNSEEMSWVAKSCYNFLNRQVKKQPDLDAQVKEIVSSMPFVYADDEFVPVEVVAKKVPFHALPYLHKLPKEYENFDELWSCVGLQEEFSTEDYLSALKRMSVEKGERPLSTSEFQLALHLINHSLMTQNSQNLINRQLIFLPDKQGVLRHVDKIFYYDTPWLSCEENLHFCHELVPRAVVSMLGVKTKIHYTLQKLKLGGLTKWVSEFGAREKLTIRIKNLIKEYSSKKDILKELIQNADDCEASEIHFVLDCRTHQTKRTFGDRWNKLQGPALCVYNNKIFKSKDIDGIQQLGIGGKEDRLDKTGKFGLGFNSVYHITDCPAFVTGNATLCIFDPNLTFLESADETSPGGMFSVNNEFKITFADVYDTFLPSEFKLEEGTVFRLPLRMSNTVSESKISEQTSTLDDIRSMCKELKNDADNMILFLNNIRRIHFSEIATNGCIKEILSIESKMDDCDKKEFSSFQQKFSKLAGNSANFSDTPPFQVIYRLQIARNDSSRATNWLIAKQVGTEGLDTLKKVSNRLHQSIIPHGAVAAYLPISGHLSDRLLMNWKGRAFCTLPFPLETGLPVHVNANFIVDSARRGICIEDGDSPKTEWNEFLLSDIIAPLYCCVLKRLCKIFTKLKGEPLIFPNVDSSSWFLNSYFAHFPAVKISVPPQWQTLVKEVYLTIFKSKAQVIPTYKEHEVKESGMISTVRVLWSSIGKPSILEEPFFLPQEQYKIIGNVLQNIKMHIAFGGFMDFLCKEFKSAGVPVVELSPQTLCEFLRHCQLLPDGQVLPAPVSVSLFRNVESCKKILAYCLKDCSQNPVDLQGVPLLVTVDGMLRSFERNDPKFFSGFSELFPEESNQFSTFQDSFLMESGFLEPLTLENSVCFVKRHLGPLHDLSSSKSKCGLTLSKEKESWLKKLWKFFKSEIFKQEKDGRKAHFETIVSDYEHWAILPVCYEQEPKILSFAHVKDTIFPLRSDIAKYMLKLEFPELNLSLLPHDLVDFFKPYLIDPENVGSVLEHLSLRTDLKWELLEGLDLDMILAWILSQLQKQTNQKNIKDLQCLPLFETFDGKRRRLNGCQKIYILHTALKLGSLELSEINSQTAFLKKNSLNEQASRIMNIPIINGLQLITEFLLFHLEFLSENQLLGVLELVMKLQSSPAFQSNKELIFHSLRHVKLIRSKEGVLEPVSYFYDHTVKLFSTFGLQDYFVPSDVLKMFERFKSPFEKLLLELGIKRYFTEYDVIRFATQVEKEAKMMVPSKSLTAKAKELFAYLLSMDMDRMSANFPSEVGNIKFIIPFDLQEELKDLHPSFAGEVLTVALKGSLLVRKDDQEQLVWTSMALIEKCIEGKKKQIFMKRCGVHLEPAVQKVIENMKNICSTQCNKKQFQTRGQVLKIAYDFLQNHIDNVDYHSLENVPFILVENDAILAEPKQIVFSLQNHDDFRPYLYKLPPLLACFSNLFQKVGVEEEASILHFARVLSAIHEETLDKISLHANLTKTVSETTKQFFTLLEKPVPKDLQNLKPLFLPAIDGKLYESSGLILNDCRSDKIMSELSGIFRFLHSDMDRYRTKHLLNVLPVDIRPRLLSDITEESISNFEACPLGEGCTKKRKFTELLLSPIFSEGLVCLLCKQSNGEITQKAAEQTCNNIFGRIQIICCRKLQTSLVYEKATLEGTTSEKTVFVRYVDMCCQIYLEHGKLTKQTEVFQVLQSLSREINKLIGNVLDRSSQDVVTVMLASEDPEEMIEVLKRHEVWSNRLQTKNAFTLPKPGEKIPDEWYDYLDMNVQNTFRVGDYVGYMVPGEDEEYLYAVVVEELEAKTFGNYQLPMYCINIGQEETIEVSVLDLYQFKRPPSHNSKALVPLGIPPPHQQQIDDRWFESSVEKIKADIDLQLSQIWQLPQAEKTKALRRLYLKYHPDKNDGHEDISTEIFKYLQQRVKELESGEKKDNLSNHTTPNHHSSSFEGFSTFWGKWDREASHHRQNREHFSRKTRCNYDFGHHHGSAPQPKPQEAERWLRQAEFDLKAAENDVNRYTEWVFYKVHQAVEKALFAAQYIKKGKIDRDADIAQLACTVATYSSELGSIGDQVSQMKALGVDNKGTQYPDYHSPPQIPNDGFASDKEEEVITLAADVLRRITSYVRL
ncbi:sacsin-like [Rana temporaria]|uniref:sacsin-like n=1 Tax=Rana temporaria TaxID=8407 RepID=UPI001AADA57B|nr:sacsin-like [Rana temporaria]